MYESIDSLCAVAGNLLRNLKPLSDVDVDEIRCGFPGVPEDYLAFLRERGYGVLDENEATFPLLVINRKPIDAAKDYFGDDLIYEDGPYEPGAKGVVWMFAADSTGTAFCFDSGDNWRLMEVDNGRCITRLDLSFRQFIEGIFVCYPYRPVRFSSGAWIDSEGVEYSIARRS